MPSHDRATTCVTILSSPPALAAEYMALPVSQYSVLDAERIERVDESTFRCYAHRINLFAVEIQPVILVRVDAQPDGCIIRLISCKVGGCAKNRPQRKGEVPVPGLPCALL